MKKFQARFTYGGFNAAIGRLVALVQLSQSQVVELGFGSQLAALGYTQEAGFITCQIDATLSSEEVQAAILNLNEQKQNKGQVPLVGLELDPEACQLRTNKINDWKGSVAYRSLAIVGHDGRVWRASQPSRNVCPSDAGQTSWQEISWRPANLYPQTGGYGLDLSSPIWPEARIKISDADKGARLPDHVRNEVLAAKEALLASFAERQQGGATAAVVAAYTPSGADIQTPSGTTAPSAVSSTEDLPF